MRVRVCSCQLRTIGFSCASAEIYDHHFSYSVASSFEIPLGQRIRHQRGKQVLPPKTGDSQTHPAEKRVKKNLPNPLTLTRFFIYRRFTRNPSASHINALANNWGLLVRPAGVKRTTWSNEIKLAERKSLLLIIAEKGLSLSSIMMEGMQKGDIKDSAELFGCE